MPAVSAAVHTWCGGEMNILGAAAKRVRVLVTRCSSKNSKRNHQPKKRSLPSSSTKQSAQQRVREQHTQGTTSPLKPLLSSSDGARSCRLLFAVSAAVRTWCGGETSTSKRVRVLVTRCSSKISKRNRRIRVCVYPSCARWLVAKKFGCKRAHIN